MAGAAGGATAQTGQPLMNWAIQNGYKPYTGPVQNSLQGVGTMGTNIGSGAAPSGSVSPYKGISGARLTGVPGDPSSSGAWNGTGSDVNTYTGSPMASVQGGGPATLPPMQTPTGAPQPFNVNTAAAQGLQSAMANTAQGQYYQPQQVQATGYRPAMVGSTGYRPATMTAGQLATTDLSSYMNPYDESVIQGLQKDAMTGQQMASNELGAQATAAGAFGGSRHGVAEGTMAANIQNNLNQQIAGLRQGGFQNAQQMALSDIGNRMGASQANMAALNAAGQFGAGAANQAMLQNQAAMNQAGQFGAQNMMTAQQLNQSAGLQGAQQRLGAASQMGSLAGQAFDMGQQATANLQNVGLQQQAIQQALIDAAKGQYAGYTGAPAQALGYLAQALGASPQPSTTTESKQPGLFDYLTMAATTAGSIYGKK